MDFLLENMLSSTSEEEKWSALAMKLGLNIHSSQDFFFQVCKDMGLDVSNVK